MMFRKLYWVAEDVRPLGSSQIRGVFTSIPHLVRCGIPDKFEPDQFRLSLTRLDTTPAIVGVWYGHDFERLYADLQSFVDSEEIDDDQRSLLLEVLKKATVGSTQGAVRR